MLKAVIVDDENKAIKSLLWELSNFKKDIEVVKTFTKAELALEYLSANKIDCLFLDIEMPKMDGFQFIEKLSKRDFAIVITTAYNQYAIKAIKKETLDYLLKPVDSDDLEVTINKVKAYSKKVKQDDTTEKLEEILVKFNENFKQKKIIINTDGRLLFLDVNEILYVESDGNYSSINTPSKKIVITKKLKEVYNLLPEDTFFRIHNSYVINLQKIKEFYKTDGYVIVENNVKIPVSRQKKSEFLEKF